MLSGRVRVSGHPSAPRRRWLPLLVAGLWAVSSLSWHAPAASADSLAAPQLDGYRLGVFPYLPVLMIDRVFGPVAAQLAEDLGRPVHLKTKPDFEKFLAELREESYDIILVHPFFYIEAHDRHRYLPLARVEEPLTGVVMVREGDRLETLADLKGKTLALPPALAAVSELVKLALFKTGLVPDVHVRLEHYRSKPSCLHAVAAGRAAACGLPRFALAQIDPDNDLELRPVFETEAVSNFVFAVHARVPEADRTNLCNSILAWPFTAAGRSILAGGAWSRFVPARDQDYDPVRRYRRHLQMLAQG